MKPFTLPTAPIGPAMLEPLNLGMYGGYGIGKTPICCELTRHYPILDAILFDLQRGSLTYQGMSVDVRKEAEERGIPYYAMFEIAARELLTRRPHFAIVDTIGDLADWADAKALDRFRASPIGKSWPYKDENGVVVKRGFDEPSILDLPGERGSAGFGKMWDAFQQLLDCCMGSWHRTIFIGHPRDKIAFATGKDPNVKQDNFASPDDIDLTGKMRRMFTSRMAAVGFMTRNWQGTGTEVTFTSRDAFAKTRCPHLDGRTLPFSNPCTLHEWARIYPQTLGEYLLPEDRAALADLLARFNGAPAAPPASAPSTSAA